MKRKKRQAEFGLGTCPAGHGNMFWMAESAKYYCAHQMHDMTGGKQWYSKDEVAALVAGKGGK